MSLAALHTAPCGEEALAEPGFSEKYERAYRVLNDYRLVVARATVSSGDLPTKWMASSPVRFRG